MTQLASRNPSELARPTTGVGQLSNGDAEDLTLPRAHIVQDMKSEKEKYGKDAKEGTIVNTLTGEIIKGKKFVPIMGWKEWIKWKEPRGSGMEYKTRNKAEVPPEDLSWNNGKPSVTEYMNWVVVFDGCDMPVVLSFSSTNMKTGKTLATLQQIAGGGFNLYALEIKDQKNDKGAWVAPIIRPAGKPDGKLLELAKQFSASFAGKTVEASSDDEPIEG